MLDMLNVGIEFSTLQFKMQNCGSVCQIGADVHDSCTMNDAGSVRNSWEKRDAGEYLHENNLDQIEA